MAIDYNKMIQQYQQQLQQLQNSTNSNPVLNFNFQQQQQANNEALELQEFAKTPEGMKLNEEGQLLMKKQQEAFNRYRANKQDPTRVEQAAKIEELTKKFDESEKRNNEMYNMVAYLTKALGGGEKVEPKGNI